MFKVCVSLIKGLGLEVNKTDFTLHRLFHYGQLFTTQGLMETEPAHHSFMVMRTSDL
jgi:hypothetical protein